ncbi:hypothetical protein G7054_g3219 [Neopestalotiopsis clavispora]|nr:hypothetical protein G7054_g3219 [Neopestalotiopsis clavispora]
MSQASHNKRMAHSWAYPKPWFSEPLEMGYLHVPWTAEPGHLLVAIKAVAINPIDGQLIDKAMDLCTTIGRPYAKIAGQAFSGVVLDAAPDLPFTRNDEIMGVTHSTGTLTELAHIDVSRSAIVKKPERLTWENAASIPVAYLTACTIFEQCYPILERNGRHKVTVLGGESPIGLYFLQQAARQGWHIQSTGYGKAEVAFIMSHGAHRVTDMMTSTPQVLLHDISKFQPNVIVDCLCQGHWSGMAETVISVKEDIWKTIQRNGRFYDVSLPIYNMRLSSDWLQRGSLLGQNSIYVDSFFPFERVKEAFSRMNSSQCRGSVVILLDPDGARYRRLFHRQLFH